MQNLGQVGFCWLNDSLARDILGINSAIRSAKWMWTVKTMMSSSSRAAPVLRLRWGQATQRPRGPCWNAKPATHLHRQSHIRLHPVHLRPLGRLWRQLEPAGILHHLPCSSNNNNNSSLRANMDSFWRLSRTWGKIFDRHMRAARRQLNDSSEGSCTHEFSCESVWWSVTRQHALNVAKSVSSRPEHLGKTGTSKEF